MDSPQISSPDTKEQDPRTVVVELSQLLTWNKKQAAMMCGVSSATYSAWVREGSMPQPFKNGRYSAAAIRAVLASNNHVAELETAYGRWKAAS